MYIAGFSTDCNTVEMKKMVKYQENATGKIFLIFFLIESLKNLSIK